MKRVVLSIAALIMLAGAFSPAQAQEHRHKHCWYSHHHRHCRWS
jgi:Ni/Co efflux regulator RcnB